MTTPAKLGLLACLYISQGLPFGFFTQALPVILREQRFSLGVIGLTALLNLPWAFKFLWAPLVDRFGSARIGRRRSWILPLQALAATLLFFLGFIDPQKDFHILLVGVLLTNLLAATQDIATDALAVDLLDEEERGPGNGVQVAGYRIGMILSGGVLLWLYDGLGWQKTFLSLAGLIGLATLPVLLHREREHAATQDPPSLREAALGFLARPGIVSWLVVLGLYKSGEWLATSMLRPLLVDQGVTLAEIGTLLGIVGFTAGLLGALVGGFATRWLGRRRAVIGFGLFQAATVAGYLLPAGGQVDPLILYSVCGLEHFAGGTATAALFTIMMDLCRPKTAATDYTLQASVVVLASLLAAAVSGYSAEALGYALHFLLATIVCVGAVLVAATVTSRSSLNRVERSSAVFLP